MCPWIDLELQILPLFRTASVSRCQLLRYPSLAAGLEKNNKRERKGKRILVAVARYCSALVPDQMEALVAL